jgi:hypothetical protein
VVSASRSAPAPGAAWIVSAPYDCLFFSGSLAIPAVLWLAFHLSLLSGIAVYALFQLLFNMPHNFQTWTLTLLDPEDRARHGRRYALAALAIFVAFGGALWLSPKLIYPWLRDGLLYWGYYHLVRQHYGFQRIYQRKLGGVSQRESFWTSRYLEAVCLLPLLWRFRDPARMTVDAGGVRFWIHHPLFSRSAFLACVALEALVVLAALAAQLWMLARGRRGLLPRALLLLSVTLAFGAAGLEKNVLVAVALLTTFHNLQYIGLVWFHNATRAGRGEARGNRPVVWIQTNRLPLYAGMSLLYGLALFLPRILAGGARLAELPVTFVVALHYYVDGRAWRFDLYPERGLWLRLRR